MRKGGEKKTGSLDFKVDFNVKELDGLDDVMGRKYDVPKFELQCQFDRLMEAKREIQKIRLLANM